MGDVPYNIIVKEDSGDTILPLLSVTLLEGSA